MTDFATEEIAEVKADFEAEEGNNEENQEENQGENSGGFVHKAITAAKVAGGAVVGGVALHIATPYIGMLVDDVKGIVDPSKRKEKPEKPEKKSLRQKALEWRIEKEEDKKKRSSEIHQKRINDLQNKLNKKYGKKDDGNQDAGKNPVNENPAEEQEPDKATEPENKQ